MGKRKKKKPNIPRHLRMKRPQRLQAAEHWIPKYKGENLVKGYGRHFGVPQLCALKELEMLGYTYSETYKQKLKDTEHLKQREAEKRNAAKKRKKEEQMEDDWDEFSDDTFAFIAGYTSGGAPFGTTWEELEENERDQATISIEELDEIHGKNDFTEGNKDPFYEDDASYNPWPIDIDDTDLPF